MYSYPSSILLRAEAENIFALVDCGIEPTILHRLGTYLNKNNHVRLFSGTFAAGAEDYSPVIIDLKVIGVNRGAFVQRLANRCSGKPLLSFLSAPCSLNEIAEHLRNFLKIETADKQEFLLRFADIRMLPEVFGVLNPDQRSAFFGPVSKWWAANHRGSVLEMTSPSSNDNAHFDFPLKLDDYQLSRLLEKTSLYSVVSQLEEENPAFAAENSVAARVSFVEGNRHHAIQHGFHEMGDILAWCTCALISGENFYKHPVFAQLLSSRQEKAKSLFELCGELKDDEWQLVKNFSSFEPE